MKLIKMFVFFALFAGANRSIAWDGFDYDKVNYIEIEKGNLVREGREIEYFDYSDASYKNGTVESISKTGSNVELEIIDESSNEIRTFEMD